jgi:hypothetical protein
LDSQKVKTMNSRNIRILTQVMLHLVAYLTSRKTTERNSHTYQDLARYVFSTTAQARNFLCGRACSEGASNQVKQ